MTEEYWIKDEKLRGQAVFVCRRLREAIAIVMIALFVLWFAHPVSAADSGNMGAPIGDQPLDVQPTEIVTLVDKPIEVVKPDLHMHPVKESLYSENATFVQKIIKKIYNLVTLNWEQKEITTDFIDVKIDGALVAIIPSDSKFKDMPVHNECITYQYGTDDWFGCEVALQ